MFPGHQLRNTRGASIAKCARCDSLHQQATYLPPHRGADSTAPAGQTAGHRAVGCVLLRSSGWCGISAEFLASQWLSWPHMKVLRTKGPAGQRKVLNSFAAWDGAAWTVWTVPRTLGCVTWVTRGIGLQDVYIFIRIYFCKI